MPATPASQISEAMLHQSIVGGDAEASGTEEAAETAGGVSVSGAACVDCTAPVGGVAEDAASGRASGAAGADGASADDPIASTVAGIGMFTTRAGRRTASGARGTSSQSA